MSNQAPDGKQRRFISTRRCVLVALLAALPVSGFAADDYYTEPQVFGMRPSPNSEKELGPIGVTGIEARIERGVKVTVESTQPGTPAQGKFSKGDIIVGVNGTMLQGKHPQVVLGGALTVAEAKDGVLKHLRKGRNTLAVLSNVRFEPNRATGQYEHIGQIDLWLEGLKRAELGSAR